MRIIFAGLLGFLLLTLGVRAEGSGAYRRVLEIAAKFPKQKEKERVRAVDELAALGSVAIGEIQHIYEQRNYGPAVMEACEKAFAAMGSAGEAAALDSLERVASKQGYLEMQEQGLRRLGKAQQVLALSEQLRTPDLLMRYMALQGIRHYELKELLPKLGDARTETRNRLIAKALDALINDFKAKPSK